MFDKINGPANEFEGPAVGHTTEKGDSWHVAVGKINAAFEKIEGFFKGSAEDAASAAEQRIEDLEHGLANLQQKYDSLLKLIQTPAAEPPATPAPVPGIAKLADAEQKIADPVMPASTSTQPPADAGQQASGANDAPANPQPSNDTLATAAATAANNVRTV